MFPFENIKNVCQMLSRGLYMRVHYMYENLVIIKKLTKKK